MIGKILFTLITFTIIVLAYLPALGVNFDKIINPTCALTNTCTRYIYTWQNVQHTFADQWVITDFSASVRGQPNPPPFSVIYYTGPVTAKIRLYDSNLKLLQENTYSNGFDMGLNSNWDFGWTFMAVPNGNYQVGVQYYSATGQALTNERTLTVVVS